MKTIITTIFTMFVIAVNAQTNDVSTQQQPETTTQAHEVADLMVSIPMIGNISLKNCNAKMQEELKPLTMIKVIKTSETSLPVYSNSEETMAVAYDALKEVTMPLQ